MPRQAQAGKPWPLLLLLPLLSLILPLLLLLPSFPTLHLHLELQG
jgi:hypothetical protein